MDSNLDLRKKSDVIHAIILCYQLCKRFKKDNQMLLMLWFGDAKTCETNFEMSS